MLLSNLCWRITLAQSIFIDIMASSLTGSYSPSCVPSGRQIGHVRYIIILTWLRGFRVKIVNFLSFFCLSIPKRDSNTKKTTPNIEVWPESLGAMLEYWYIERGLLQRGLFQSKVTSSLACIQSQVAKHTTVKWPILHTFYQTVLSCHAHIFRLLWATAASFHTPSN